MTDESPRDHGLWRDLIAFWFLGLCNNFGYSVMLSAAHDIIGKFEDAPKKDDEEYERHCHTLSTGAVLLADVFPAFFVKLIAPFLPFWVNTRVVLEVILSAAGFIVVAVATARHVALFGVILTSAAYGLGSSTFLSVSAQFNKNVVSTWSSGTGGAGILASFSYAALRQLGLSSRDTLLVMLIIPTIEAVAFWLILRMPETVESTPSTDKDESELHGFKEKLFYIKHLLPYIIPLSLVYFFQYFINMGMFELVNFENTFIDVPSQFRWFNFAYQLGVFISRSSVNIYQVRKLWILPIFQGLNLLYFLTEVFVYYTPTIWITFLIVFWEGLVGGCAYVNTYYKISTDIPRERRIYALGIVVNSDSYGKIAAGVLAMPVHNSICKLTAPKRWFT